MDEGRVHVANDGMKKTRIQTAQLHKWPQVVREVGKLLEYLVRRPVPPGASPTTPAARLILGVVGYLQG